MTPGRFSDIASKYAALRIAVMGDFCLDRYLEIDPGRPEISIETGLPVHNVINVRAQPGGAGTIVNNLSALGVGTILPVGFAGEDGEGYELSGALKALAGVRLDHLLLSPDLARRLTSAGIDRAARGRPNASDHAPVWIELKPARKYR